MKAFIPFLAQLSRSPSIRVDAELDGALAHLDHMLEGLCGALKVEYLGPFVGVERLDAHRLVVREHMWRLGAPAWSLKICPTAPAANWRAEWAIQSASRMRKPIIVRALPEFFCGFAAAVDAAGKSSLPAAGRLREVAALFGAAEIANE